MRVYAEKPGDRADLQAKAAALQPEGTVQRTGAEHPLLQLQRQYGNRFVQRMLTADRAAEEPVQAKTNAAAGSPAGGRLLAHEPAQVVEQSQGLQADVVQRVKVKNTNGRATSRSKGVVTKSRTGKGAVTKTGRAMSRFRQNQRTRGARPGTPSPAKNLKYGRVAKRGPRVRGVGARNLNRPIVPAITNRAASVGGEPELDPGGRGAWQLDKSVMEGLAKPDREEMKKWHSVVPPSLQYLEDLVNRRSRVVSTDLSEEKVGTPEHMLSRWRRYVARPSKGTMAKKNFKGTMAKKNFEQWVKTYGTGMRNSVIGILREWAYRNAFEKANIATTSPVITNAAGVRRQVDILIPAALGRKPIAIQIKAGKESLTTRDRISGGDKQGAASHGNQGALEYDKELLEAGYQVVWVFEKMPTGPLVRFAIEKQVEAVICVDDDEKEKEMRDLMVGAGMVDSQINNVRLFKGTKDQLVPWVVQTYGA